MKADDLPDEPLPDEAPRRSDECTDSEWETELLRRASEIRSGIAKGYTMDEVFAEFPPERGAESSGG